MWTLERCYAINWYIVEQMIFAIFKIGHIDSHVYYLWIKFRRSYRKVVDSPCGIRRSSICCIGNIPHQFEVTRSTIVYCNYFSIIVSGLTKLQAISHCVSCFNIRIVVISYITVNEYYCLHVVWIWITFEFADLNNQTIVNNCIEIIYSGYWYIEITTKILNVRILAINLSTS